MTKPYAIVVQPTTVYNEGLTYYGAGLPGAIAPFTGAWLPRPPRLDRPDHASSLPVWWAGNVHPHGWDWLRRWWWEREYTEHPDTPEYGDAPLRFEPSLEEALAFCRALELAGLIRVTLFDLSADGKGLVERAA